jgi:hypothetical protein
MVRHLQVLGADAVDNLFNRGHDKLWTVVPASTPAKAFAPHGKVDIE